MRILCEAQAVDMHLFLFAASEKSSRAFSKFEIVRMEPRNWEACEKCGDGDGEHEEQQQHTMDGSSDESDDVLGQALPRESLVTCGVAVTERV